MDIRSLTITSTELSNRAKNALKRAGIHTVGDLMQQDEESLTYIRSLGRKTIEEIIQKIDEYKTIEEKGSVSTAVFEPVQTDIPADFTTLIQEEAGREYVVSWLKKK